MLLKMVSLLVLITAITGSQAEPVRSGFWDYFSQLTHDKEFQKPTQLQKTARKVEGLKHNFQDGVNYMRNFLGPLNGRTQQTLYQNSDGLRQLIQQELEDLRSKLSPYVDEVHQRISRNVEQFRQSLMPFTKELLDQVDLKTKELQEHLNPYNYNMKGQLLESVDEVQKFITQHAEHFQDKITFHTGQVKHTFNPYADKLVSGIHQTVQEIHKNVAPHTQISQERLNQYIQELSQKLTKTAKNLHEKIHKNLDELREKLNFFQNGFWQKLFEQVEGPQPKVISPSMEEVTKKVQERIEEFRRNTFLQIDDFTKTINRETEEMKYKLFPSPQIEEFQDSLSPVEEMQARLNSLWENLSQSLS
ncbi:apolipoprotein A-V [Microcaecilia unicolor]|uniref:Apolipoprotein A-V n=1 Tax=Microcaecilia unicolor TaxID=1415580 RepID=A0A6P7ZVR8_9AMPH|nr:apolipoprotein A-V [Microcaecilia unicolor]XP_030077870.1 apolipoprotein A-V [Microcaecilia unicolor]